jgi:hypothetical protein
MKMRIFPFLVLLVTTLALTRVSAAVDQTPQEKFAESAALMNSHKFAEALPILEDLRISYPTASVFWNLGMSAAEVGNYDEALHAWLSNRELAPNNWQTRAKLVQAYQALGNLKARDQERADLVALWQAGTDQQLSAQPIFCREQFKQDGHKVMVLEYFNPSGPNLVVYSFVVVNESGKQDFKISLGSYDTTNQVALELGQRPKDKRIYHLDLYRSNLHETHGLYLGQPSYDEIRRVVVEVLAGQHKPISSSTVPTPIAH